MAEEEEVVAGCEGRTLKREAEEEAVRNGKVGVEVVQERRGDAEANRREEGEEDRKEEVARIAVGRGHAKGASVSWRYWPRSLSHTRWRCHRGCASPTDDGRRREVQRGDRRKWEERLT